MLNSSKQNRFKLIKKTIEFKQSALQRKLIEFNATIEKKELVINRFEIYLKEYGQDINSNKGLVTVNFINLQKFLNQIAKVLSKEKEELKVLQLERDELRIELVKNLNQVDVIDEVLSKLGRSPIL